jgi:hypothetical protein
MLRFHRNDGSTSPATAEYVELFDDGRFTGWRSIAPSVGWFEGALEPPDLDDIRSALGGVADDPGPPPPGPTVETLELPDRDPLVVTGVDRDGPLGVLVEHARRLLDAMVDSPRSAIALEPGSPTRLVHRGTEPLHVDLSTVVLQANHWRGYYEPAGTAQEVLSGPSVQADPGWTFDLPSITPAPAGPDITTHLTVDFAIVANGNVVPVQVQHLPTIDSPSD